ncbi:MAG: M48 family metalloprotease [Verrucomicrobiota bacterium]
MDEPEHSLEPLPYHVELRDYLKSQERELWNWFASARAQADYTENLRTALLKSTYRLDAESHPEIYQRVEAAKSRLQLDIPVTVYQAQNSPQPNAALYFIPGEGHVVLSGPVLSLLNAEEIKSVLGHELAHYRLWQWEQGELHIADRLIQAVAGDPRAAETHEQTARRFQLYTEIFADRGSLCVTGDLNPVIAGLVKIETGLAQVSAPAYLKHADELFSKTGVTTEGLSHPEAFIRARALALWHEQSHAAQPHITRMIEGAEALDRLDLLGQTRMVKNTRRLLEHLLQPKWFQTPAVLGHAKLFFDDLQPATTRDTSALKAFTSPDARTQEYLSYVLLDFVTADPELEEVPLAAALELSRELAFDAQFEKLAAKELKLKIRDVRKLKEQAAEMLVKAEVAG